MPTTRRTNEISLSHTHEPLVLWRFFISIYLILHERANEGVGRTRLYDDIQFAFDCEIFIFFSEIFAEEVRQVHGAT